MLLISRIRLFILYLTIIICAHAEHSSFAVMKEPDLKNRACFEVLNNKYLMNKIAEFIDLSTVAKLNTANSACFSATRHILKLAKLLNQKRALKYPGSEAEVLLKARENRLNTNTDIVSISLNGNPISIERPYEIAYKIENPHAAQLVNVPVGTVLTKSQIELFAEPIQRKFEEYSGIEAFGPSPLHPAFAIRPIEYPDELEFNQIINDIYEEIKNLNKSAMSGYYLKYGGPLNVNSNPEDRKEFSELLDSIKTHNKKEFKKHMIEIATRFSKGNVDAKNTVIESLTYLFVTKQFPSEGLRGQLFNSILTCGKFY